MKYLNGAFVIAALLGTAALHPQAAEAYPPIPPLRYEAIPPAPGPGYVWRPGYWHWDNRGYISGVVSVKVVEIGV